MMRLSKPTQVFMPAFILSMLLLPAVAGAGDPGIAMILSTSGEVRAGGNGMEPAKALPMMVLEDGQTLETGTGASATLVLFAENREYIVAKSSRVVLHRDRLETLEGSVKAEKSRLPVNLPHNSSISSRRLLGETIRNVGAGRNIFLHPANASCVLEGTLNFCWRLEEKPAKVRFALYDGDDNEILSTEVEGDTLSYPPEDKSPLTPGGNYYAEVSPVGSGSDVTILTEFSVLSEEDAEKMRTCRRETLTCLKSDPADPAPSMILMLLCLENKLFHEAVETGRKLESLIPDNPNLHRYQAHAYRNMGLTDLALAEVRNAGDLEKE